MKLGCVLTACNLNKKYTRFIPIFINKWTKFFPEIKIVIVLIASEIPEYLIQYKEYLTLFPEIKDMNTAYISQVIRILYPALIQIEDAVIITDMDMIPMNRNFYKSFETLHDITENNFVNLSPEGTAGNSNEIILWYNLATPKVWSQIFGISDVLDIVIFLKSHYDSDFQGNHGGVGWFSDQQLLKKYVPENILVYLKRDVTKFNRLDCPKGWNYDGSAIFHDFEYIKSQITNETYSDIHFYGSECPYTSFNDLMT